MDPLGGWLADDFCTQTHPIFGEFVQEFLTKKRPLHELGLPVYPIKDRHVE